MQAAVGIAQMNKLAKIIEKKDQIHKKYKKELKIFFNMKHCIIYNFAFPIIVKSIEYKMRDK